MTALILLLLVVSGCATPAGPPAPATEGLAEPHDAALTKLEAENQALRKQLRDFETELEAVRRDIARLAAEARATAAAAPVDAERLYADGLAHLRARRYADAAARLTELLRRFPAHPLAPNAQYWIAEARYGERNYAQAVLEFEKVLARTDGAGKAPDALLMIAQAYRNLGDAPRARDALRRLLDRYPESDAARVGRRLLQTAR